MKVKVKAPFFSDYGLFKKGDILEVKESDFDNSLMEPVTDPEKAPEDPKKEEQKAPAKRGRKKEA